MSHKVQSNVEDLAVTLKTMAEAEGWEVVRGLGPELEEPQAGPK